MLRRQGKTPSFEADLFPQRGRRAAGHVVRLLLEPPLETNGPHADGEFGPMPLLDLAPTDIAKDRRKGT